MIELAANIKAEIQEFFNTTYTAHVLNREPLGFNSRTGVCSYRDGCAVGILLTPQEIASIPLDSDGDEAVGGVLDLLAEADITTFDGTHVKFLSHMQYAHDRAVQYNTIEAYDGLGFTINNTLTKASKKGRWYFARHNYQMVAKAYGLTIPS